MARLLSIRAFGVLVLALIVGHVEAAERVGELIGTVVNFDGQPVPDAVVSLVSGSAPHETIATVRTTVDGRFRIGPLAPVCHAHLFVDAPGYGREYCKSVFLFPDSVNQVRVVVARGRTVAGTILGINGQPVTDVVVRFHLYRVVLGRVVIEEVGREGQTKTDSRGIFQVPSIPACSFSIDVRLPEAAIGSLREEIQPGSGLHTLRTLRLVPDVPIAGFVHDVKGKPLANILVNTNFGDGPTAKSDRSGKFVLRGFSGDQIPSVRLEVKAPGFARAVVPVGENRKPLDVPLKRQQWISGRVVDAETGAPVAIKKMVLCTSTRRDSGEIYRGNCRPVPFEQPQTGHFRVAYDSLLEHHITVMADGFEDAESLVESPRDYKDIQGIVIKTRRSGSKAQAAVVPVPKITGTLTRGGRPVTSAWVSIVREREERKLPDVSIRRGRTVPADPWVPRSTIPSPEGVYSLDATDQGSWYVVIEEANRSATVRGPFDLKLNQVLKLDAGLSDGGSINGRVKQIPSDSAGHWWVVAFNRNVWRSEARVARDGTFQLDHLPPGEYGLKVGHDGYQDPDVFDGASTASSRKDANPWHDAALVQVRPGQTATGVLLDTPKTVTKP
jgi:hypothetical protein